MALYSVVVPVYNSEKTLDELYLRIKNVFENTVKEKFELILVDDFSKDSSYEVMRTIQKNDSRVKIIQLSKNHGQQKAVLCGFEFTRGDYVITMDDDLQHPPEEIPKLIEKMNSDENIDVVIGRYISKKHGIVRKVGTKLMDRMSSYVFNKSKDVKLTSFRLIKRCVIDNVNRINISKPTVGHVLLQTTERIANVPVEHDKRKVGKSGYNFKKLVKTFITNMINTTDLPLIIIGRIGVISMFTCFALVAYYIFRYFRFGTPVAGFTTLVTVILFLNGLTLFSIGILGRYLMNIISESKKMPKYFIREVVAANKDEKSRDE